MSIALIEGLVAIVLAVCERLEPGEAEAIVKAILRTLTGADPNPAVALAPDFKSQVESLRAELLRDARDTIESFDAGDDEPTQKWRR